MYVKQNLFAAAMKPARHARLFELIKQADWAGATHHRKPTSQEADMLAFRDMAAGSLLR